MKRNPKRLRDEFYPNQESEVLSQEWIEGNTSPVDDEGRLYIWKRDLENLIVPKQELPVVLSQEWISDNAVVGQYPNGLGHVVPAYKLQSLLVPNQELPVIPKYVADWITKYREVLDLYPALRRLEDNTSIWGRVYEWYRTNTHDFVNAYLTGEYEVEEEPLYYALIKGHELVNDGKIYWNYVKSDGSVLISEPFRPTNFFLSQMTKEEWNKLGINDSNADFVKVEENE